MCLGVVDNAGGRLFSANNDVCVEQKNVLNALVLKKRSEAVRLNKFFSLLQNATRRGKGVKMKPRGGERDNRKFALFLIHAACGSDEFLAAGDQSGILQG